MGETKYIKSDYVSVFPSSLRSGNYSDGKFTTEKNLTRFLKSVTDRESFVVAGPYDPSSELGTGDPHYNPTHYIFIINGFYFEVNADEVTDNLKFASINLDKATGRLLAWKTGDDILDSDNTFKALYLSEETPTTSNVDLVVYTLNFRDAKKFAKFSTDTFFWNDKSLQDILDSKQDEITTTNPLDISAGLVTGVLPVTNGGTGVNNVDDALVGKAKHLVSDSGVINTGDANHPVFFLGGVPSKVDVVENASKLTTLNKVGLTVGSAEKPVYFSNGYPTEVGSKLSVHAAGLNEGKGGIDVDSASGSSTYTSVYFNEGGSATEGVHIFITPNTVTTPPATGNVGDIWFKYQA